jgi:hypothetical protein
VGIVRINGPRAIYDNNERIKVHSFNAREKREMAVSSASAAAPSASVTPPSASATQSSASVTQLSASAAVSARVVSSLVEMRRAGCVVRSVGQTDGRTNRCNVLRVGSIFLLLAVGEE